jgi:hypothetical protein
MSITTSQDHPAARLEFTEEHGVDPGLGSAIFAGVGLALIVIGDFASFNIALSRTFTTMSAVMVVLLTLAMTAAAVVLMLEAGKAEARRRSRNTGRAGRGPVRNRIMAWALLGAMAFLLRLAAPPETTGDTSGFGTAASSGFGSAASGATSGFGQATDASSSLLLGPMTLHGENLASALALIAIFIAGGVGAFYLGRESHNPLLTEVRRARRTEVWTRWRLGTAQRRADRAARRAGDLGAAREQAERASKELAVLDDLDHQLDLYAAAAKDLADSSARVRQLTDQAAATESELSSLADEVRLEQRRADHAGDQAKALSRILIAGYKGEPAATSGLTNGTQQ